MGESRYAGATDLYGGIMGVFQGGITFQQPDVKITNDAAVQSKINRFRDSTLPLTDLHLTEPRIYLMHIVRYSLSFLCSLQLEW